GRTLYSIGYGERTIAVWDLLARKPLRRLPQPPDLPSAVYVGALSQDGKTLALAVRPNQTVFLIDTATGKEMQQLKPVEGGVDQPASTPDGRTLVVFCFDRSIQFWDLSTGTRLRQLLPPGIVPPRGISRPVGLDAVALSPDGKLLAYTQNNGCPTLMQLATG